MAEEPKEELLTVREVARRLRVDDTTVRRWIKSGSLEAITLPHRGNGMRIASNDQPLIHCSPALFLLPYFSGDHDG